MSVRPSVRPQIWNNSASTERIFMKFCIWVFFENSSFIKIWQEWPVHYTEDQYTFFTIPHSLLLIITHVSDTSCKENQNTQFVFNDFFSRKSCCLWDNVESIVEPDRLQMAICRKRITCCIPKATNTLRICNIYAFPLQQWSHEGASVLRYTCTACLVKIRKCLPPGTYLLILMVA